MHGPWHMPDPDPHGRQEAFEAAQQDAEDESLMDAINDFDPNELSRLEALRAGVK